MFLVLGTPHRLRHGRGFYRYLVCMYNANMLNRFQNRYKIDFEKHSIYGELTKAIFRTPLRQNRRFGLRGSVEKQSTMPFQSGHKMYNMHINIHAGIYIAYSYMRIRRAYKLCAHNPNLGFHRWKSRFLNVFGIRHSTSAKASAKARWRILPISCMYV